MTSAGSGGGEQRRNPYPPHAVAGQADQVEEGGVGLSDDRVAVGRQGHPRSRDGGLAEDGRQHRRRPAGVVLGEPALADHRGQHEHGDGHHQQVHLRREHLLRGGRLIEGVGTRARRRREGDAQHGQTREEGRQRYGVADGGGEQQRHHEVLRAGNGGAERRDEDEHEHRDEDRTPEEHLPVLAQPHCAPCPATQAQHGGAPGDEPDDGAQAELGCGAGAVAGRAPARQGDHEGREQADGPCPDRGEGDPRRVRTQPGQVAPMGAHDAGEGHDRDNVDGDLQGEDPALDLVAVPDGEGDRRHEQERQPAPHVEDDEQAGGDSPADPRDGDALAGRDHRLDEQQVDGPEGSPPQQVPQLGHVSLPADAPMCVRRHGIQRGHPSTGNARERRAPVPSWLCSPHPTRKPIR